MPRAPRDPNAPPRRRSRRASLDTPATQAGATVVPDPTRAAMAEAIRQAHAPASNSEHARLSPSASSRWLNCPASIVLAEQLRAQPGYVEPPDGEAAIAGRTMHALAEALLRGDPHAEEGHSREHVDLVQPYINHVRGLLELMPNATLLVEERVSTNVVTCWGTVDCAIYNQPTDELWVIDLKTGHGRVAAVENTQLAIYALGVEERLNDTPGVRVGSSRHNTRYYLQIVQPRDEEEPIKTWATTWTWLQAVNNGLYAATNALLDIANGIADPEPRLGDWCQYCPAASNCPAMRNRTLTVFDHDAETTPESQGLVPVMGQNINVLPRDVAALLPEQIAFFLDHTPVIEGFLAACKQRALSEVIPGYKLVEARTRRRWENEAEVIAALVAAGRNDLLRQLPPTIGEAERALGRGHAIVRAYAVAPAGVPTVAPESDPRPALDRNLVFRVESPDRVASPE